MIRVISIRLQSLFTVARWQDVLALCKVRLSSSVVFSALAGYLLGADPVNWTDLLLLTAGGFLVVGASNAINQVIEKEQDARMDRTRNRPVAAGRMTPAGAVSWAALFGLLGLWMLYLINPMSAGFGALSIFFYTALYTPLKGVTSWAVLVGAIPGAIPSLLGWVAATNDFDIEPGVLFALQFVWQFPHFWAIAWLLHDDYAKAGYNLLPSGKRDRASSFQVMIYSLWLIPLAVLPAFGFTGDLKLSVWAAIAVGLLGVWLAARSVRLFLKGETADARRVMFASIAFLPLVQLIYVIDRFI